MVALRSRVQSHTALLIQFILLTRALDKFSLYCIVLYCDNISFPSLTVLISIAPGLYKLSLGLCACGEKLERPLMMMRASFVYRTKNMR